MKTLKEKGKKERKKKTLPESRKKEEAIVKGLTKIRPHGNINIKELICRDKMID